MKSKALITSASNKFFPSLLNLIGSLKANYPNHPTLFIYSLGLSDLFKNSLKKIDNVEILEIPKFTSFWRKCYTWKTYIINTPLSDLNLYLDAGCQILRPLEELFEKIEKNDYLLVGQGHGIMLKNVTPENYLELLEIPKEQYDEEVITAGIFGFKKDSKISIITKKLYSAGLSGLCLGFSKGEQWKNKGVDKNIFVRDCPMFRHDTTLLTLLVKKYMVDAIIEPIHNFSPEKTNSDSQFIWNLRMNYRKLDYLNNIKLSYPVKLFIFLFIKAKNINQFIKFGK